MLGYAFNLYIILFMCLILFPLFHNFKNIWYIFLTMCPVIASIKKKKQYKCWDKDRNYLALLDIDHTVVGYFSPGSAPVLV